MTLVTLAGAARQRYDVVVIGGGINGAGIARQTQAAGYRTLLVERDDFASGTTSRATRLIHGGLRYLEHAEIGLVYESLSEREALLRDYPHLVRPLRMLLPVYRGDARPPWKVRAGLALYDALSLRKSLPRHRAVPLRSVDHTAEGLSHDGLRAAYTFSDAQVEFPERLVIETVRDFVALGGVALNHVAAVRLASPGGSLRGVVVRDACSGEEAEIGAPIAVNAAGPWVDEFLRGSDAERHDPLIGGTKGSHLVADWSGAPRHAIFASARSDGRPFFILPWYRYTLIGTTDIRHHGDPSLASTTADEVRYLVDETRRLFPEHSLAYEHVLYTYCGVRPLPYTERGEEASITRRHFVVDHVKRGGPSGLFSVVGGKLTNYRGLARMCVAAIAKRSSPSGVPRGVPPVRASAEGAPTLAIYGTRAAEIEALAEADPGLRAPICAHNPELMAQVAYAVDSEYARTLGDVLLRRLPAGWSACHAMDGIDAIAALVGARLGWDASQASREIDAYRAELRRTLVPPPDAGR